ncbi:MAG: TlpA family protein disulfide reductase [Acidiferrobacteraceae bacterium]
MPCRRSLIFAGAGLVALAAVALLAERRTPMAPTLRLPLLTGGSVMIGRGQRSPLLLIFWSVACTPCLQQVPRIVRVWRARHALGVHVIVVVQAGDPESVVRTFASRALPCPVALDVGNRAAHDFAVRSIPHVILIGRRGHIRLDVSGGVSASAIIRSVRAWRAHAGSGTAHALD